MSTVLDTLITRLTLDGSGFQRGLKNAQMAARDFSRNVGSELKGSIAGAFSVVAVTAFARSISNAVSDIQDLADRLQLSTDNVQKLQIGAKLAGTNFETVSQAITLMYDGLIDGSKSAMKGLDGLGISIEEIQGKSFNDAFDLITKKLSAMTNQAKQAEVAFALFGSRGGPKALQVIKAMQGVNGVPFSAGLIKSTDSTMDNLSLAAKSVGGLAMKGIVEPAMDLGALPMTYFRALSTGENPKDIWNAYKGFTPAEPDILSDSTKRQMGIKSGLQFGGDEEYDGRLQKAKDWMAMQDEILKIEEETKRNREETRVQGLTVDQQRNELLKERVKLLIEEFGLTELDKAKRENRVSEIDKILAMLNQSGGRDYASESTFFRRQSDWLTSIGGFTGAGGGQQNQTSQMLSTLQQILNTLESRGIRLRGKF